MQHYVSATNSEIAARISERIHSARDRRILHLRHIDGLTYEAIAEAVELSTVQVKRIVRRDTEKIRK